LAHRTTATAWSTPVPKVLADRAAAANHIRLNPSRSRWRTQLTFILREFMLNVARHRGSVMMEVPARRPGTAGLGDTRGFTLTQP
jgi:hypothetical protein